MSFSCIRRYNDDVNAKVFVDYQDGRAILYRNGEPYTIKGGAGTDHIQKIAEYGGNSLRTWSLADAERILDEAEKHGLTVTLGIEIGRPHWGEDFNYANWWAVSRKIEELKPVIAKLKDHPALLMWGVGNEVDLHGGNRYLVYLTINRVAKMIKNIDPDHPTMTAINAKTVGRARYLLSDIDIMGYNAFAGVEEFFAQNKNYNPMGWQKAYIFAELGPPGHWEVENTEWGAPIEYQGADRIALLKKYWALVDTDTLAHLGTYSFYWGFKHQITQTWFSHFNKEGAESESVKFLFSKWTNQIPDNESPRITALHLNGQIPGKNTYLYADSLYYFEVKAENPENTPIRYKWEFTDEETHFDRVGPYYYNMRHLFENDSSNNTGFRAPKDEGAYRLYVFAYDRHNNFTSQNLPVYILNR